MCIAAPPQIARLEDERDDAFRERENALAEREATLLQVRPGTCKSTNYASPLAAQHMQPVLDHAVLICSPPDA
jgi:hypothetical protein